MHFFSFAVFVYEVPKIRRQRRQRQCQGNRLNLQNKNFARDALGFVHFFTITARLPRENASFHDLSGRKQPRRRNFLSHSELGYGSQEFNSGRVPLPFLLPSPSWVFKVPYLISRKREYKTRATKHST